MYKSYCLRESSQVLTAHRFRNDEVDLYYVFFYKRSLSMNISCPSFVGCFSLSRLLGLGAHIGTGAGVVAIANPA